MLDGEARTAGAPLEIAIIMLTLVELVLGVLHASLWRPGRVTSTRTPT